MARPTCGVNSDGLRTTVFPATRARCPFEGNGKAIRRARGDGRNGSVRGSAIRRRGPRRSWAGHDSDAGAGRDGCRCALRCGRWGVADLFAAPPSLRRRRLSIDDELTEPRTHTVLEIGIRIATECPAGRPEHCLLVREIRRRRPTRAGTCSEHTALEEARAGSAEQGDFATATGAQYSAARPPIWRSRSSWLRIKWRAPHPLHAVIGFCELISVSILAESLRQPGSSGYADDIMKSGPAFAETDQFDPGACRRSSRDRAPQSITAH